jgi:hypothetical protein
LNNAIASKIRKYNKAKRKNKWSEEKIPGDAPRSNLWTIEITATFRWTEAIRDNQWENNLTHNMTKQTLNSE